MIEGTLTRFLFCLLLMLAASLAYARAPGRFSFAIIGDAPYNSREETLFEQMLAEINQENVAFVVHVGDIKDGSSPCSDELYEARKRMFQASRYPFILVPGDNDWTDCHRRGAGRYDPLERLVKLRQVFYADERSLGQNTLELERQSDAPGTESRFREYRENVRWTADGVLFVGLNVPGSNNNFGRTAQMDAEHAQRGAANTAWLKQAFELAHSKDCAAVFVFIQANPDFDLSYLRRVNRADGYAALKRELLAHALAFGKPVVLVHGDTHRFRIDHPLYDPATLGRVEQFTRVESFGSPFVDWIKVTIDPGNPKLISYRTGRTPNYGQ